MLTQLELAKQKGQQAMAARNFISPMWAAVLGLVLFLPGLAMIALLMLNIEPAFIQRLLPPPPVDQPNVVGSLVAVTLIVIFPLIALTLNWMRVWRTMRAGGSVLAHPVNLALVVVTLLLLVVFVGAIVVDQWPCWMGVPNCD